MTRHQPEQAAEAASYLEDARTFEPAWQRRWRESDALAADLQSGLPKQVILDFFPYPSGAGLHVGHPLGYLATDTFARYRRMQGYNVLHSMGFDSFGLPAEQYAIQTNRHPRETTAENVANILRQLRLLGLGHDESRRFLTSDPAYYRWTQWIFLQIHDSVWDADARWTDGLRRTVTGRAVTASEMRRMLATGERCVGTDGLPASSGSAGARRAQAGEIERVIDRSRLARMQEVEVNWCPMLGTVLANEEVTADRHSERGNYPVYRRALKQWTLRISCYADRLDQDLSLLDWPPGIVQMQHNWIGARDGVELRFPVQGEDALSVFTTRPDTIHGVTFLALAAEHPLARRLLPARLLDPLGGAASADPPAGLRLPFEAIHPLTGATLPVFVAPYVLSAYGTGAVMGVPAHDARDFTFATSMGLAVVPVIEPEDTWLIASGPPGTAIEDLRELYRRDPAAFGRAYEACSSLLGCPANPAHLHGAPTSLAQAQVLADLQAASAGRATRTYRLRDWIFSRQRYWGEPFPIVYDEDTLEPHALADSELPVQLPPMEDFSPEVSDDPDMPVRTPLDRAPGWLHVWGRVVGDGRVILTAPGDPGARRFLRDPNTMPNWAGSCWYYLRYFDAHSDTAFVSTEAERYWSGGPAAAAAVDLYVGGAEHAVLHLLYARFWHKVLYDRGLVSTPEPFARLFSQGMITADAYQDARGFYVDPHDVSLRMQDEVEVAIDKNSGEQLTIHAGKMGKRYKNGVPPEEVTARHSVDAYRCYMLFLGPLSSSTPWREEPIAGMTRFLSSVWQMAHGPLEDALDPEVDRIVHRTIHAVTADLEALRFNTALSSLMKLHNAIEAAPGRPARQHVETLVRLLQPFAPHLAAELQDTCLACPAAAIRWPSCDLKKLALARLTLVVQVNGRVRAQIPIGADADAASREAAARAEASVAEHRSGRTVRKLVHVARGETRLINFVVT
jgi:leucyl-tRNA synthetase